MEIERAFVKFVQLYDYSDGSVFFPVCVSTNVEAKTLAREGAQDCTAVLAYEQTGGRGRNNRGWVSGAGTGVYLSVLLRPKIDTAFIPLLPLLTALSVCEALRGMCVPAGIKWPNDVVACGKKLCGILLEGGSGADGGFCAAAGIGLNVAQTQADFTAQELPHAASLASLGYTTGYEDALGALMKTFAGEYRAFCMQPDALLSRYKDCCVTLGSHVLVRERDVSYEARAVDIAGDGALVIETEGGKKAVYAADVSVRGLMGYV